VANTIRNCGNNIARFTAAELRLLQVSKYTDYPEKKSAVVEQRSLQVEKGIPLADLQRPELRSIWVQMRVCPSQTGYGRLERVDPYRPSADWLGFRRGLQEPEGSCGLRGDP
jgi:hypothetical protein